MAIGKELLDFIQLKDDLLVMLWDKNQGWKPVSSTCSFLADADVLSMNLDELRNIIIEDDQKIYDIFVEKIKAGMEGASDRIGINENIVNVTVRMKNQTGIEYYNVECHLKKDANNAIIKMMDLIKELQNIEFNERNTLYEIPHTTMNIGKITGGTAVNIVPDLCSLKFDFRTINIDEHYYIEKKLKEIEKSFNCKIEKQLEVYPLVNRNNLTFPSKVINFVTEAGFYPSSEKIILGVGPVNPHEDNEKVSVSSLSKCKEQYKDIIIRYCL